MPSSRRRCATPKARTPCRPAAAMSSAATENTPTTTAASRCVDTLRTTPRASAPAASAPAADRWPASPGAAARPRVRAARSSRPRRWGCGTARRRSRRGSRPRPRPAARRRGVPARCRGPRRGRRRPLRPRSATALSRPLRSRLPTASSPGQNCRAAVSLTSDRHLAAAAIGRRAGPRPAANRHAERFEIAGRDPRVDRHRRTGRGVATLDR